MSLIYDALRQLEPEGSISAANIREFEVHPTPWWRQQQRIIRGVVLATAAVAMSLAAAWMWRDAGVNVDPDINATVGQDAAAASTAPIAGAPPPNTAMSRVRIDAAPEPKLAPDSVPLPGPVVLTTIDPVSLTPIAVGAVTYTPSPTVQIETASATTAAADNAVEQVEPSSAGGAEDSSIAPGATNLLAAPSVAVTDSRALVRSLRNAIDDRDELAVTIGFEALEALMGSDNPMAQRLRGYWALLQGRHAEAIGYYRKVLDRQPEDLLANTNMALAEWQLGQRQGAVERLDKLRSLYPDDARVRRYLMTMEAGG